MWQNCASLAAQLAGLCTSRAEPLNFPEPFPQTTLATCVAGAPPGAAEVGYPPANGRLRATGQSAQAAARKEQLAS
jgi:hypothetical protein